MTHNDTLTRLRKAVMNAAGISWFCKDHKLDISAVIDAYEGTTPPGDAIMRAVENVENGQSRQRRLTSLQEWCVARCDIGGPTQSQHLYDDYLAWCEERSITPESRRAFGQWMRPRFNGRKTAGLVKYNVGLQQSTHNKDTQ